MTVHFKRFQGKKISRIVGTEISRWKEKTKNVGTEKSTIQTERKINGIGQKNWFVLRCRQDSNLRGETPMDF